MLAESTQFQLSYGKMSCHNRLSSSAYQWRCNNIISYLWLICKKFKNRISRYNFFNTIIISANTSSNQMTAWQWSPQLWPLMSCVLNCTSSRYFIGFIGSISLTTLTPLSPMTFDCRGGEGVCRQGNCSMWIRLDTAGEPLNSCLSSRGPQLVQDNGWMYEDVSTWHQI